MNWTLSPGVAFCEVGPRLIFFDLQTDRYLTLAGRDLSTFQAMRAGRPVSESDAARLIDSGLVAGGQSSRTLEPATVVIPQDDLSAWGEHRASPGGLARVAVSVIRAKRAVRRSRIAQAIFSLDRRKRRLEHAAEAAAVIETALLFAACRPLVPIARRCLIDSLALMDLLIARGQTATLVFGVRANPFAAHCWVQTEQRILTCAADDALGFTPIMVV